ncbi:hypothetical protein GHT06_019071 [Daphnia sinensis]|uniref:ZSWIM1/3 RNaseH-like domain-containing protein n=1 Tax=Daphnia sinensis TaxID=1820382 RepID=A0AAD5L9X7_9CRUS|nr:hypothetical protein GHT06_019071 [Daphnia sinensis]
MKQALTGLFSEVWQSTTELLANLTSNTENIVNVTSDENGEIKCIFVQLSEQRRFYKRYGEVLQLDGTHSVTNTPMPLYTLIVKENYGVGQPVAFFSGKTHIYFYLQNNDNSITELFLTDKDCAEIAAIKCHFPNAKHLLCHFHALRAVDRRLNETDLSKGFKEEIYQEYLCALEDDSLGRYFDTFWFNTDWVTTWPILYRRNLCTLGDNTTNRIERYHLTIKNVLNRKGRKFNTVVQTLLDIATSRLLDRDMKELENQIRFPTTSFSPLLEKLRGKLTTYAWDLVRKQAEKPITSYKIVKFERTTSYTHNSHKY